MKRERGVEGYPNNPIFQILPQIPFPMPKFNCQIALPVCRVSNPIFPLTKGKSQFSFYPFSTLTMNCFFFYIKLRVCYSYEQWQRPPPPPPPKKKAFPWYPISQNSSDLSINTQAHLFGVNMGTLWFHVHAYILPELSSQIYSLRFS